MRKMLLPHIVYMICRYTVMATCCFFVCWSIFFVCAKMDFSMRSYEIIGVNDGDYCEQHTYLKSLLGSNIFALKRFEVEEKFRSNGWVADVYMRRKLPSQLLIHVRERLPVAIWKNDESLSLIDAKNNIIRTNNLKKFAHLPIISGDLERFDEVWSGFELYPALVQKIIYLERVHNRRWNICVLPNVIIKLPEAGFAKALRVLYNSGYGIVREDVSMIDCRVPGKVVVRKR